MARKKHTEEKPAESTDSVVPAAVVAAPAESPAPVAVEHPRRKATCPSCNVGVAVSTTVKSNGAYVYGCPECGHRWVS